MLDLLIEGLDSLRLPCSWVILFPAAALTLYARHRNTLVIVVFIAWAAVVAWFRFAGWWFAVPTGIEQVALGLVVAGAALAAWRRDSGVTDAGLAAITAVTAMSAWIPCVGPHLGSLLNDARTAPLPNAPGTLAYVVGLLLPFALVPAALILAPAVGDRLRHPAVVIVGVAGLVLFAALFVTTLLDDVSSELARRSTF